MYIWEFKDVYIDMYYEWNTNGMRMGYEWDTTKQLNRYKDLTKKGKKGKKG